MKLYKNLGCAIKGGKVREAFSHATEILGLYDPKPILLIYSDGDPNHNLLQLLLINMHTLVDAIIQKLFSGMFTFLYVCVVCVCVWVYKHSALLYWLDTPAFHELLHSMFLQPIKLIHGLAG